MTDQQQKDADPELVAVSADLRRAGDTPVVALGIIEQIRGGADLRMNWSSLRALIQVLHQRQQAITYGIDEKSNFSFFRARKSDADSLFRNISDLSFRDPATVRDFGRCHKPGGSMFYGSFNEDTVFSELSPDVGDRMHLALARLKPEQSVKVAVIGECDYGRRYGRSLLFNNLIPPVADLLSNLNEPLNLKRLITDAFYADLFVRRADNSNYYKATSALSDLITSVEQDGDLLIDGLAYPSVGHRGGINVAITPVAFTRALKIEECQVYSITGYLGSGIYKRDLVLRSESIAENGEIQWVEPS
jgi:hypothetical protein